MSEMLSVMYLTLDKGSLRDELAQCRDEGRDLSAVEAQFAQVMELDLDQPANQQRAAALLDRTIALPTRPGYPHDEPSDLEGIRALTVAGLQRRRAADPLSLSDRLHGAWLGRCAGCLLGKPVEGRHREKIWAYLKDTGQWPLSAYMRRNDADRKSVV